MASALAEEESNDIDPTGLPKNADTLKKHFDCNSLNTIAPFLTERIPVLKRKTLNIAVTGHAGTGKSSFVNAIRGLTAEDQDASPVDIVECTWQCDPYPHPSNPNICFWDLPGAGTTAFPKDDYIDKMHFENYDLFILVCAERFREIDMWLAKEIDRRGKDMIFIRTKVDEDVLNWNRGRSNKCDKESILSKIREDCLKNLKRGNITDPIIFLISNFETNKWDFPLLSEILVDNWKSLKNKSVSADLFLICTYSIKVKQEALMKKIATSASSAAKHCFVLIPGWSNSTSKSTLQSEIKHLKKEFSLDEESLEKLSEQFGRQPGYLNEHVLNAVSKITADQWVSQLLKDDHTFSFAEWRRFLPIVGPILSYSDIYYGIHGHLRTVLDILGDDIKTVFKEVVKIIVEDNMD